MTCSYNIIPSHSYHSIMSVYTLHLPSLPLVIIRKHLSALPQIYRSSLLLHHSLEVSLKTKRVCFAALKLCP